MITIANPLSGSSISGDFLGRSVGARRRARRRRDKRTANAQLEIEREQAARTGVVQYGSSGRKSAVARARHRQALEKKAAAQVVQPSAPVAKAPVRKPFRTGYAPSGAARRSMLERMTKRATTLVVAKAKEAVKTGVATPKQVAIVRASIDPVVVEVAKQEVVAKDAGYQPETSEISRGVVTAAPATTVAPATTDAPNEAEGEAEAPAKSGVPVIAFVAAAAVAYLAFKG